MSALRKSGKRFFSRISATKRVLNFSIAIFHRNDPYITKEGWFICRGHECRCELLIYLFIYLFPQISLHLGVYLFVVNYHLMFPVHTSPPSCNGYLAFAGVPIQLTALTYQLQEFASTG